MSESMVRRLVRRFNEARDQLHNNERSDHSSVVSDKLVRADKEKIKENRKCTIN